MCSSPLIEGGIIRDHLLKPKLWTCYIHQIQHSKCPDSRIVKQYINGYLFLMLSNLLPVVVFIYGTFTHSKQIWHNSLWNKICSEFVLSLFWVSYVMDAIIHHKSHIGLTHFTTEQICSEFIVCTLHEFCHRDSFRTKPNSLNTNLLWVYASVGFVTCDQAPNFWPSPT